MDPFFELLRHPKDPELHREQFSRCEGCRLQKRICMCAQIPRLVTKTRLQLLIHHKETKRPTNSGLLAAQCLENSEVKLRGAPGEDHGDYPFDFTGYQPILLFPNDQAQMLSAELVAQFDKPVTLIVPDGNWNQASRMPRRIKQLHDVPTVILPPGPPSNYRLRSEERRPEGMATLEAIVRAFDILGEHHVVQPILEIFELMVMRTLWSKGVISTNDAAHFLPRTSQ